MSIITLPSVRYSGRVEMRMYAGRGEMGRESGCCTNPEPCVTLLLEKLRKSDWSLTYIQGSVMAATGEWRDELCCSILTSLIALVSLLIQRLHYPGNCSKPSLVKLCGGLVQIFNNSLCTTSNCQRRLFEPLP